MQFARKVNEHEWEYAQAYDTQNLSLGYYEEDIDLSEYSDEEKADAIQGYYTPEVYAKFSKKEQVQLTCECMFEQHFYEEALATL